MPRITRLGSRTNPLGLALTLYEIYRRLPPRQRRQLMDLTLRHGPRVAKAAFTRGRAVRPKRP